MPNTRFQPTLPAEVAPSEAELNFIDESPPKLFPENQNSNWGLKRRNFTSQIQLGIDQLNEMFAEHFVATSQIFLDEWEKQEGLPRNPTGKSILTRRAYLASRIQTGPFTNARRSALVEQYIQAAAVAGAPTMFTATGLVLDASGIPMYGDFGAVGSLYRIYDDLANFSYVVRIKNTVAPDTVAMIRELTRLTPAGISFTIDNTVANVLKWDSAILDLGPSGWWKLGADYNDYSGLGHNGTVTGAPTAIATPGLNNASISGTDAARLFSGTGQYVTIADSARLNANAITFFALARPDVLPTAGNYSMIYSAGGGSYIGILGATPSKFVVSLIIDGVQRALVSTTTPVAGTIYRVGATYDGMTIKLFVNGIVEASQVIIGKLDTTGTKYIGGYTAPGNYLWNGGLDEIIYLGYALKDARMLEISNTTQNIA